MKKRLKKAKDITVGDTIKISGYTYEVDSVDITPTGVHLILWPWASPRKRLELHFSDKTFPVTVR